MEKPQRCWSTQGKATSSFKQSYPKLKPNLVKGSVADSPSRPQTPSWIERVKPVQAVSKSKSRYKHTGNSVKPNCDLSHKLFQSYDHLSGSKQNVNICVNGRLSDSSYARQLMKKCNKGDRNNTTLDMSDTESIENITLDDNVCSGDYEKSENLKLPLCWEDLQTTAVSSRGSEASVSQCSSGLMPPASSQFSLVNIGSTSSKKNGLISGVKLSSPAHIETMVTWRDMCLLPWASSPQQRSSHCLECSDSEILDPSINNSFETVSKVVSSPTQSLPIPVENILKISKGAGRLIGVTEVNQFDDLLCIWMKSSTEEDCFSFERSQFEVYLSSKTNGHVTTAALQKEPKSVLHNLYFLKFHLTAVIPWLPDPKMLQGRTLEISVNISKPQRLKGNVFRQLLTIPEGDSNDKELPSTSNQFQSNTCRNLTDDDDKMTFTVHDTLINPDSAAGQEAILQIYDNPYQISKSSLKEPLDIPRKSQTFSAIARARIGSFFQDPSPSATSLLQDNYAHINLKDYSHGQTCKFNHNGISGPKSKNAHQTENGKVSSSGLKIIPRPIQVYLPSQEDCVQLQEWKPPRQDNSFNLPDLVNLDLKDTDND